MSDHIDKTIDTLEEKLVELSQEGIKIKKTINQLLELDGKEQRYVDDDLAASTGQNLTIRHDEFFTKPLATCVRIILERRKALNQGAAPLNEIFDALQAGSYDMGNKNLAIAKRNIAITLSKNTGFLRLPNDTWGIRDWYDVKTPKKSPKENNNNDSVEPPYIDEQLEDPTNDQPNEENTS